MVALLSVLGDGLTGFGCPPLPDGKWALRKRLLLVIDLSDAIVSMSMVRLLFSLDTLT